MVEFKNDFEYAKWCLLNELDRLAIPTEMRKSIEELVQEEVTEEKAKVKTLRRNNERKFK